MKTHSSPPSRLVRDEARDGITTHKQPVRQPEVAWLTEKRDKLLHSVACFEREIYYAESGVLGEALVSQASRRGLEAAEYELLNIQKMLARLGPGSTRPSAPVADADGWEGLKPDPVTARTPAELVAAVRQYRQWSGEPSFRTMAARARQTVAHTTMFMALKNDGLPRLDVVLAIVAGCNGSEDDRRAFATAWRRIRLGRIGAGAG